MRKLIFFLLCFIAPHFNSNVFSQEVDTLKISDILTMSFTDLMNIEVISASKMQQHIKDVSATVQVITAEQIKERLYFTIEDVLSDLPGFQFRNIVGFNSYVFLRGAPNQNNLILLLIDGVQINELNSGGFYAGGQFILSDIDRIEVVYGPASALYGTNAVSGIINIVTKEPKGKNTGHVSLLGGSFKTGMADFSFKNYNSEKAIGYSFSGMYKTSEKADLRGEKGDNNWTNDMENFENDIALSGKMNIKNFSVGVTFQDKMASKTTNYKSVGEKYLDKNSLWDIAFLNSYIKYNYSKNEKIILNSSLYYRNATVKLNTIDHVEKATDTTPGKQVGYYRPNQLAGIENQINYNATEWLMVIGGTIVEMEQLSDGFSITSSSSEVTLPPTPAKPSVLNNYLFSYYLQTDIEIYNQLSFIGGLRHDFSSYYGQVFTPRVGFVFNKDKFTAKIQYNNAFRAPKPWDYNYGMGNANLKPEKMHAFELFGSCTLNDNLSIGSSVYKYLINDKLINDTTENSVRWINKNELNTWGFEVYSNYSIRAFSIYANYTYNNSYDQDNILIPEISMHTANAGVTYSFNSHVKVNLKTNYLGERKNPFEIPSIGNTQIDDAFLLHSCISYFDLKGMDFQFKVNNLLNKEYYHPSNQLIGRYRQPQQTFILIISYNF